MLVTGIFLQQKVKNVRGTLDVLYDEFKESLTKFKNEDKRSPIDIMDEIANLESTVVKIQLAQSKINSTILFPVSFEVFGQTKMSLLEAIKLAGTLSRIEKEWKTASKKEKRNIFGQDSRKGDEEYAERVLSPKTCLKESIIWSKKLNFLREKIAISNTKEIDIPELQNLDEIMS